MPRVARVVVSGLPHHVTQRGNNRQDVFFTDDDRRHYLQVLLESARRCDVEVGGYCLMANHVHLILTPRRAEALAAAVGRTHLIYTQYVNRLHGRGGHLWQNRFFSCPLDESHLVAAMRYVERNPVRAKMCRAPWKYAWSSAAAHCGERADETGLLDPAWWRGFVRPGAWRTMLKQAGDEAVGEALRRATRTGRPLGSDRFLAKLETKLGRRLRVRPRGRPRAGDAAPRGRRGKRS